MYVYVCIVYMYRGICIFISHFYHASLFFLTQVPRIHSHPMTLQKSCQDWMSSDEGVLRQDQALRGLESAFEITSMGQGI